MPTTHKGRKAPVTDKVRHLLTSTPLSIAEVARRVRTNKRYVREIADREKLPTNRPLSPTGPAADRVRAFATKHGAEKARTKFRFSARKLATVSKAR